MRIPLFKQLSFTANGHFLSTETAIEFQQTIISIKAEIPNENHPLRSARLLVLKQAEAIIQYAIEQEQLQTQQELATSEK